MHKNFLPAEVTLLKNTIKYDTPLKNLFSICDYKRNFVFGQKFDIKLKTKLFNRKKALLLNSKSKRSEKK